MGFRVWALSKRQARKDPADLRGHLCVTGMVPICARQGSGASILVQFPAIFQESAFAVDDPRVRLDMDALRRSQELLRWELVAFAYEGLTHVTFAVDDLSFLLVNGVIL